MKVTEFEARKIERIADSLAFFVQTTPPDKLSWQPGAGPQVHTRSVYQIVSECIHVNRYFAALLRGTELAWHPNEAQDIEFGAAADAQRQLIESARDLAEAVRGLTDDDLAREFPHWRAPVLGEKAIDAPCRNMEYHAGQVNLIQLLLGDTEFHVPPKWR